MGTAMRSLPWKINCSCWNSF